MSIIESCMDTSSVVTDVTDVSDTSQENSIVDELETLIQKHMDFYELHGSALEKLNSISSNINNKSEEDINVAFKDSHVDLHEVLDELHTDSLKNIETTGHMTFGQSLINILENTLSMSVANV